MAAEKGADYEVDNDFVFLFSNPIPTDKRMHEPCEYNLVQIYMMPKFISANEQLFYLKMNDTALC